MIFHGQTSWVAIRMLAKTPVNRPLVRRSFAHLRSQDNLGTPPLYGLFSKLLTKKHNWTPTRQFAAKVHDGDGDGLSENSGTRKF